MSKISDVLAEDFKAVVKNADNKKAIWLAWDQVYREASSKAVKDDDVSWNDTVHKAVDALANYLLKPKA